MWPLLQELEEGAKEQHSQLLVRKLGQLWAVDAREAEAIGLVADITATSAAGAVNNNDITRLQALYLSDHPPVRTHP